MPNLSKADKAATVSLTEARRRKECALSQLRELEVKQRLGKLLPAAQVTSAWSSIAGKIRDAVLRIPDKCAPSVAAAGDLQECREILATECEQILRTLSDDLLRFDQPSN